MRLIAYIASIIVLFAIANTASAQVRYSAAELPRSAPGSAQQAGLRLLTWPGKVAPPATPASPTAARPYGRGGVAPIIPAQGAITGPLAPTAPPLPVSIYAPPPQAVQQPAAPAQPQAAAPKALAMISPAPIDGPLTPKLYSVHRPYGETPDPIPLTPQFFSQSSPDLAAPPPPVQRPQTTATGRVIRPSAPDPDTSSPAGG